MFRNGRENLSERLAGHINTVLPRFPHYDADGTFVIRDVTLGELLDAVGIEFRGYGISNSGYLEVYVESSSTYSPQDLLNVYNLIQETAFMNGYDTAVPVLFLQPAAYVFPPEMSAPSSVVTSAAGPGRWDQIAAWIGRWWEGRLKEGYF